MRIAYQGIKYSNSYFAAMEIAKRAKIEKEAILLPAKTSQGVVDMLDSGRADIGVVAKINTTMGTVQETKKALDGRTYEVFDTLFLPINHCLFGVNGSSINDMKEVVSHPQALGQCSGFLKENMPKALKVPCADTSQSAKNLYKSKKTRQAVICSEQAGISRGLKLLRSGIQDNPDNKTKFIAIENLNQEENPISLRVLNLVNKIPLIGTLLAPLCISLNTQGYWLYTINSKDQNKNTLPYDLKRVVQIKYKPFRGIYIQGWTEGNSTKMFESLCSWSAISEMGRVFLSYEYKVEKLFGNNIRGWATLKSSEKIGKTRINNMKGIYSSRDKKENGEIVYTRITKSLFNRLRRTHEKK